MRLVFVDTLYFVARINPFDQWHARAKDALASLTFSSLITTESVLIELLNFFAAYQADMRQTVARFVRDTLGDHDIEVIPHTRDAFIEGLALYESRLDKGYSLTNCIPMGVMRQRNIADVLTPDHHFEQEGFTILL